MKNLPRPPRRTYRCTNPQCEEFSKPRTITLQHLGQGLYLSPLTLLVCECGSEVDLVWWDDDTNDRPLPRPKPLKTKRRGY